MRHAISGLALVLLAVGASDASIRLRVDVGPGPDDTHIVNDPAVPLPPFPTLILECERSHPFRIPEFFADNGSAIPYTIAALPPVGTKLRARVQLMIGSGGIEVRTPRALKPQSPAIQNFEVDPMFGLASATP